MSFTSAVAIAAIGASIYQGEEMKRAQKAGLRAQERAQNEAKSLMERQQRMAEEEISRANRKQPDISSLLARAKQPLRLASMLTSPGGVAADKLRLGRLTLLGEAV